MFSSCSKSNLKYHPSSRLQQGALCYVRPNSVPQPSHPLRGWRQQRQQHATAAHRRQPHTAEPSVRQRHKGLLLDKPLQCDPAADDLDMLAVQAAAVVQGTSSSADSRGHDLDMSRSLEAPRAQASDMQVLKPTSRAAGPAALQTTVPQGAGKRPRFTAADKLQLSEAEAKDIARRLRTPQAPEPGRPVLRIFRYGVDDLRLYKAIEAADLEGRVIIVDTMDFADAVITTVKKRTGKNVNQAVARRAAAAAGVPCLVLKAVSANRLLEALGPMLCDVPGTAPGRGRNNSKNMLQQEADEQSAVGVAPAHGTGPRLLRHNEMETVGSQELMQLLWGPAVRHQMRVPIIQLSGNDSSAGTSPSNSTCMEPRWTAWCACQTAETVQGMFEAVRATDIEDTRKDMQPTNPNARAGERYRLLKPLRHHSKLRKKQLRKQLAEMQADW